MPPEYLLAVMHREMKLNKLVWYISLSHAETKVLLLLRQLRRTKRHGNLCVYISFFYATLRRIKHSERVVCLVLHRTKKQESVNKLNKAEN